ncbi:MAG: pyridoxamine 5'-phosphate oxidase family protein [Anaerovoracaceae bacterium]
MSNLNKSQIDEFLGKAHSAAFATVDADGYPYNVPVNFVWQDDKIYIHGRASGTKTTNCEKNSKVGLLIYHMGELEYDPNQERACAVMVHYTSVIIKGNIRRLEDPAEKQKILWDIVKKYTPPLTGASMVDADVAKTSVYEITPTSITGKTYPDE